MPVDNPDARIIDRAPFTETALKSADEIQPKAHHQGTDQQKRPTTPLINVDDRRNYEKLNQSVMGGRLARLTREQHV